MKFAIVNQKVDIIDSLNNAFQKSNKFLGIKKTDLNSLLNSAVIEKCDLIIFPENSIPWQWEHYLKLFSKKNNIAIILGYHHRRNLKNEILNEIGVFLPVTDYSNKVNSIFVDKRLKIHYSPLEIETIIGRNFLLPKKRFKTDMPIYKWKGIYFSIFNCYELADLALRSKLIGKIDLLIAIEYNRDTNYFSSVVESTSRDIHCYVIQVNTSEFGDSRILAPQNSQEKDILKLKGGENSIILTSKIDFSKLRQFQSLSQLLQNKDKTFKNTPPNYTQSVGRVDLSL
ncbi:hypothetical protein [Leptospira levettii]|uniref:hypothetical protein n=1 Tax=Leptospira levettii TaxID=2023178 RepID=UPI001438501F|nr:hypothetical protein [Leptospira levettii]